MNVKLSTLAISLVIIGLLSVLALNSLEQNAYRKNGFDTAFQERLEKIETRLDKQVDALKNEMTQKLRQAEQQTSELRAKIKQLETQKQLPLSAPAPDHSNRQSAILMSAVDPKIHKRLSKRIDHTVDSLLSARLKKIGWKKGSKVFIRIFKRENVLEAFGFHNEKWTLLKSWPICRWSGLLGPKYFEGDQQAPEGFYMISRRQLLPSSKHHRAFNLGFPNRVEQRKRKSGSHLMVHGNCSSVGCYAMTNPAIDEIYRLINEAHKGGQKHVPVHAFPFHLSEENLEKHKTHLAYEFWRKQLKPGYDAFEKSGEVPIVLACRDQYGFAVKDEEITDGCRQLLGW